MLDYWNWKQWSFSLNNSELSSETYIININTFYMYTNIIVKYTVNILHFYTLITKYKKIIYFVKK